MNTILDDISAVIGFSATLKLVAWFGDGVSNCFVPAQVDDDSTLVKIVGMSAAQRLVQEFPRQHLPVPSLQGFERETKRRTIARLLTKQISPREIAGILEISVKRVQQIEGELIQAKLLHKNTPLENALAKATHQLVEQAGFGKIEDRTAEAAMAGMVNAPSAAPKPKKEVAPRQARVKRQIQKGVDPAVANAVVDGGMPMPIEGPGLGTMLDDEDTTLDDLGLPIELPPGRMDLSDLLDL